MAVFLHRFKDHLETSTYQNWIIRPIRLTVQEGKGFEIVQFSQVRHITFTSNNTSVLWPSFPSPFLPFHPPVALPLPSPVSHGGADVSPEIAPLNAYPNTYWVKQCLQLPEDLIRNFESWFFTQGVRLEPKSPSSVNVPQISMNLTYVSSISSASI